MAQQTQKTDREQLRGILAEFDIGEATLVLDEMRAGLMPSTEGFDHQGEKCSHGKDGCVGREEFASSLEKVWDQNNLLSAHFLTEGAAVQKAIAMVTLKQAYVGLAAGSGWGSGSLVSASLFMTNNHVIPNKAFCDKVNMQFMYQNNFDGQPAIAPESFETDEDSFFHTDGALDYTIVRLKRKPYKFLSNYQPTGYRLATSYSPSGFGGGEDAGLEGADGGTEYADPDQIGLLTSLSEVIARRAPVSSINPRLISQIFGYTPGSRYGSLKLRPAISYPEGLRLNIVQHPQGRKKEVVVQQNELNDVHANVIHYYSDTDYGSSGSPVFDNKWDLMALHHARNNAESSNEGIRIDKIVADLRNEFQTTNPAILTELGI